MVFFTLAEITLEMSFWGLKKVYDIGYWIVKGHRKSETEILLEKQNETIELLHKDLLELNKKLETIEHDISS